MADNTDILRPHRQASETSRNDLSDIFGPGPDPAFVAVAEAAQAAKQARLDAKAAQKARGVARRDPLARAHLRCVLGTASGDDVRRVRRAMSSSRSYYKRKAERRAAAEAENLRKGIEGWNELVAVLNGSAQTSS